ncbi:glycoside hydrolase family 1 protein [Helcococcus kunzii]|uniref:glycoside hydrolase family 1 protein n=1 Tax=Helcococcus kunzii TaxID=40091 RepID=UPI0024AE1ACB|nr:glycoside hydrolase family 1 protein [Helcococcus kunzii]
MSKFMWGNSTSSMQTEGAYNIGGKGKSVYDIIEATENSSDWKVAIDEYHRYEEDIKLMKEMGMNAYRFQISWSRIYPKGYGQVNEEGLEFYDNLIDCLIENEIEPIICLYHFDMPLELSEKYNGFSSRTVLNYFVEYGKTVIDRFNKKVKYWLTFNEQNIFSFDAAFRIAGSKKEHTLKNLYDIQHYAIISHAKIENYIRENYPDLKIGGMLAYAPFYPNSSNPKDILLAKNYDSFYNLVHLYLFTGKGYPEFFTKYLINKGIELDITTEDIEYLNKMKSDFISFSYYQSQTVKDDNYQFNPLDKQGLVDNKYLDRSEWNWEIDPDGLYISMRNIYDFCQIPLFIVENGIGIREKLPENEYIEDDTRIKYHKGHIEAMNKAINHGVQCIGYLGWGLIDILSSTGDMEKRYGAVFVNRTNNDLKDLRRIKKKSFNYLKKVFESDGKDTEYE